MAPFTIDDAYDVVEYQQRQIDKLRQDHEKLRAWSDLNDRYIRELIDALTESVDRLLMCVDTSHITEELPKMIVAMQEKTKNEEEKS